MLGKLYIYKDKSGKFRWNFSEPAKRAGDWDIVAASTDAYPTEEKAEAAGRRVVCLCWQLETPPRHRKPRPWWRRILNALIH